MQRNSEASGSLYDVVQGGYCVGCGACAALSRQRFSMVRQPDGTIRPELPANLDQKQLSNNLAYACPFSNESISEDELAGEFLGELPKQDVRIGRYISAGVAHVGSETLRQAASSGGFARWLLAKLLDNHLVSHVAHVVSTAPAAKSSPLFRYILSNDSKEILSDGATSAYYPVHLENVISEIRGLEGTVAITAIPCFAKAIRQICKHDPELREKIRFVVGIVCGHMKSHAFAESLAWQVGVESSDLGGVDFRKKIAGVPANHKGFTAYDRSISSWTPAVDTKTLLGGNWGLGLLKNEACEFCDDVLAETADVSVGDAWLPEYISDSRGHSVVVIRNEIIEKIVSDGIRTTEISFQTIDAERVAMSQAGGLRHRREGLRYRLWLKEAKGEWHPPKRVPAGRDHISSRRRKMYEVRSALLEKSLESFAAAKKANDFSVYRYSVGPLIRKHQRLQKRMLLRVLEPILKSRLGLALIRLRNNLRNARKH